VGEVLGLRILGPFELDIDGGKPVALGGLRQRALLAILALHTNEVVAADRLIDELWGEHPPASATHTIQVFVSRLRRALGAVSSRLATAPPGYRLGVEPRELDADRCEHLYTEARVAAASGRPANAAVKLEQALELWRGPALADFTYESFAQGAIAQLEELRVSCREELVDARLALGHHAQVVHDLEALIAEHPLRERPRGQLMLALYRCGRQAEALDAYQQARHMLVEKLAIEPSGALRALEQAILQQDPSLAPAGPSGEQRASAGHPGISDPASRQDTDTVPATVTAMHEKRPGSAPPRTAAGAFVGRLDCLARLRLRWDESRAGRTNVIWLAGEAGIGKTRLATQFAEEVQIGGDVALYGRADAESLLPYQAVAEVLDDLVSHAGSGLITALKRELETLSRAFPNLRRYTPTIPVVDDPETIRYQVFEAVVSVLVRTSADTPLLVVLDDLQWADQPTLLLLRHVLRRVEGARLLVVGTFRPDETNPPLAKLLADLRRERVYDRLNLEGLDGAATAKLVADRAGIETTPGFLQHLQAQTDGNPFFVEEMLRALAEADPPVGPIMDEDDLRRVGVPEGVNEVITSRADQLEPLARELLTVASVVGPVWNLRFVEDVMRSARPDIDEELDNAPVDEISRAADEVVTAGLALELPDQFEALTFVHALVRDVFYRRLKTGRREVGRRVRLHYHVALALERLSGHAEVSPAELARHFLEARPVAGAEPARRYAIAAGRRAADQFAYEEAADHLRTALALSEESDEAGRCEIQLTLGRVQWQMGDDGARKTFLAAAQSAERRGAADQLARAASGLAERWFEIAFQGARYNDWLEKALQAIDDRDSRHRVRLLSRLALNLSYPYEDARGQALAEEAVAMARRLGNQRTLCAALLAHQTTLLDVRHIDRRLDISEELGSVSAGYEQPAAFAHQWRMYDLLGVGDLAGARREYTELARLADRLAQPLLKAIAFGARGLWAELSGDDEEAEHWAAESHRQANFAHAGDADSSWGSQMFALRRRQGRVAELTSLAESTVASGGRPLGWLSALGVLRLETGDEPAARAVYDKEMSGGPAGRPRGMFWLTRMALLSELCAGLRDGDGATELYGELLPHAGRSVVVTYCSFWGPVDGYLARLAATFGDRATAKEHADAALDQARRMRSPVIVDELQRRLDLEVAS
jgi:DNA-binding SARP family transcriptional activator